MKIRAVQTGTVAITTNWREGAGHGRLRLVNTLLDREWTEPLPIYAFAIEHPEGVIVVDTGETARISEPGYFPRWQPFFRFTVREHVRPEREIGPQLKQLGILPSDVRRVVMTHLHTDHAGGLHHFPDNEILVSTAELDYAAGPVGRLRGYPNKRWPTWFRPTLVDLPGIPFGPFPASTALSNAGDVTLVAVPGHTPGQLAVVVKDGDHASFLAGDSSYTQDALLYVQGHGWRRPRRGRRAAHPRAHPHLCSRDADHLPAGARPRDRSSAGSAPADRSRAGEGDRVITFQTSVRVERPIDEVFAFVSNPLMFPRWNSAVQTVHGTSRETGGPGSTYSMQRQLPAGQVENELEVLSRGHPTKFGIRTSSGPTPFLYNYRFVPDGADTVVHLDATVELRGVTAVLAPLAARTVRRDVDANLAALKHTLEASAPNA